MRELYDLIPAAIDQKRDLRFWHDAVRMTLSPYVLWHLAGEDGLVAGVTRDGAPMMVRLSEMVGVEVVPRQPRVPSEWRMDASDDVLTRFRRPA